MIKIFFSDDGAFDLVQVKVGLDGRDIVRLLGLLVGRPPQPKQKPEEQLPVSGHAENVQC
jgi:hypothetical protein